MGSADRLLPGFGAAALAVALTGCGRQPGHDQLRADALPLHPDCVLIDAGPSEGDSDTVYMHLRLDYTGAPQERRRVLGYRRNASGWHIFSSTIAMTGQCRRRPDNPPSPDARSNSQFLSIRSKQSNFIDVVLAVA